MSAAFEPMAEQARRALAEELRRTVGGEVRFDSGSRALYATDASNYRQVPLGVVLPRSAEDVVGCIDACRRHAAPIVPRGGGTSLAGEACNVAVMLDFSKYLDHVLDLDPGRKFAEVEPGCILDTLRDAAERYDLTFGPDPSTHDRNTLGGMIGNNSCGVHSIMAGRTADNVEALDVLTYDGLRMTVGRTDDAERQAITAGGGRRAEIYRALDEFRTRYGDLIRARYPDIPRRVSGYENLEQLLPEHGFNVARALVGTEGTCVTVLKAVVNLVPSPRRRVLAVLGFDDVYAAGDAVPRVLEDRPIGLEGMDRLLIEFIRRKGLETGSLDMLPDGGSWLIAEFGAASDEEATAAARGLIDSHRARGGAGHLVRDRDQQKRLWEVREAALAATAHVPDMPESWPGWEDSAVPREALGDYLRDLKALFARHGYEASVYGHFGDGLVHCRVPFDLRTEGGIRNWQAFLEQAADLVVRYGGSLSGEHGDGQARGALLERMYGPELMQAFREFKAIWDPQGRMNPGKVVEPFPVTSNLRIGPQYQPEPVQHFFAYAEDGGSFATATRRCVGVGACRRTDSEKGVMCPSYMVTREEKHSTRGRARLLFEMLHGGAINDRWRSREVEEALDLCLACKGCKSDCPVQVDMATYKAEFRAHHYSRRLRPRAAYTMGLIHQWSRLAARMPGVANAVMQMPVIADAVKWSAGIARQRRMPRFASQTFVDWHRARPAKPRRKGRVMLWPDTFNNYFRVGTARAAAQVLEALGYEVAVPARPLCCGRPLYDWGMLKSAKALWRQTFDSLQGEIAEGTPIVGLEPACVSAFRDELPGLLPGDERAGRLARQTLDFTEFLAQDLDELRRFEIDGPALVQLHCHHHAVIKPEAELSVLRKIGLDHAVLAAGCCGMAGSFGFEAEKYDVSMAAAERALLPRIRSARYDATVLANGFSCREQIEQGTGRRTLHIAELLAKSLGTGGNPPAGGR
ncbi:FAD-binding and (Fe-S)-binding domain-containing protein [Desertibaculum subflavum]|uniref:FAD-binding and (Fe-S)-binding domain-containing protein n=1 Tax=Desertibaculum subflavum TaxID=2268458 RepID=UPI0034D306CF